MCLFYRISLPCWFFSRFLQMWKWRITFLVKVQLLFLSQHMIKSFVLFPFVLNLARLIWMFAHPWFFPPGLERALSEQGCNADVSQAPLSLVRLLVLFHQLQCKQMEDSGDAQSPVAVVIFLPTLKVHGFPRPPLCSPFLKMLIFTVIEPSGLSLMSLVT